MLVGIEESCIGDHSGAIDVHQLLTLLHSDTWWHKSLAEVLCLQKEEKRPQFYTDLSQPTLHHLRPGHPAHLQSGRRGPGKTAKQENHPQALSASRHSCLCTHLPWLSPHAMWVPFSVAKPYNLHTNCDKAPGIPVPLDCCPTSISKILGDPPMTPQPSKINTKVLYQASKIWSLLCLQACLWPHSLNY